MKVATALMLGLGLGSCGGESAPVTSAGPELQMGAHAEPWSLARVKAIAAESTLRVHDPYEDAEVEFRGISAQEVLEAALGSEWRSASDIEFECRDGYRAIVPSSRFVDHVALFAFARSDREDFRLAKPVGERIVDTDLAPLYLVWSNLNDSVIRAEGDWGWPYQVVAIRVASANAQFSRVAPPSSVPIEVQRGFRSFRQWCSSCHAINGIGGDVGPELNQPISVTTYMAPGWLRRWIDDPQSVRRDTEMPGLRPEAPDRGQTIDDIVAYLAWVAPPVPPVPEAHP